MEKLISCVIAVIYKGSAVVQMLLVVIRQWEICASGGNFF